MNDVIPIITPMIDRDSLSWHCGLAVSREDWGYCSFLKSLNLMAEGDLRISPYIWRSLTFSFLLICSSEGFYTLLQETDLKIIAFQDRGYLVTGDLLTWQESCARICTENRQFDLRYIFDKIILFFDHWGLGEIFNAYRRLPLTDQTFILEHRR